MNHLTPMGPSRDKLLSVKEVAAWLQISETWVRAHANKDRRPYLPAIKMGKTLRFRSSDVEGFLQLCQTMDGGRKT